MTKLFGFCKRVTRKVVGAVVGAVVAVQVLPGRVMAQEDFVADDFSISMADLVDLFAAILVCLVSLFVLRKIIKTINHS